MVEKELMPVGQKVTRSSAQIVDETGELPSIAKRLKLQYGKKDSEGNPTEEIINTTSEQVLKEWRDAVKNKYGPNAEVDENGDGDLYLTLPTVKARKKNGRVFGYGSVKDAYFQFDGSSSQQGSNSVNMNQDIGHLASEVDPDKARLALMIETLSNLVVKQDKKINDLVNFVTKTMNCPVPDFLTADIAANNDADTQRDIAAADSVATAADSTATAAAENDQVVSASHDATTDKNENDPEPEPLGDP